MTNLGHPWCPMKGGIRAFGREKAGGGKMATAAATLKKTEAWGDNEEG